MKFCTEETGKRLRELGFEPTDKTWTWSLDEVLERLPHAIKRADTYYSLCFSKCATEYKGYRMYYHLIITSQFTDKNPAEAAAKLLIWCIENNYVTKEQ